MNEWIKSGEACTALGVNKTAYYRMVRAGQFQRVLWKGEEALVHRSEIYPEVPAITPVPRDVAPLVDEIRRRLDELEARLRAS